MHPLAASVRAWKLTTANTNMKATTAARIQIGVPLLVSPIQTLGLDSGSFHRFALKKAVAVKVSIGPIL